MKWLKPSVFAFILFIFAVKGVESIVQSTVAPKDVTTIDTSATVTAKKDVFRAKRADISDSEREERLRDIEYIKNQKELSDRILNTEYTRKPWQPVIDVNAIKVPIRTTTEEITTTTKKQKPTTKVDHAAQIRKENNELVTIKSETSSNKFSVADIMCLGVSGLSLLMVCCLIVFGIHKRNRRIRYMEEQHQNRFRNPQGGYNLNPQPNMTPARTATATPTSAISRTSKEGLSNEKTNN